MDDQYARLSRSPPSDAEIIATMSDEVRKDFLAVSEDLRQVTLAAYRRRHQMAFVISQVARRLSLHGVACPDVQGAAALLMAWFEIVEEQTELSLDELVEALRGAANA